MAPRPVRSPSWSVGCGNAAPSQGLLGPGVVHDVCARSSRWHLGNQAGGHDDELVGANALGSVRCSDRFGSLAIQAGHVFVLEEVSEHVHPPRYSRHVRGRVRQAPVVDGCRASLKIDLVAAPPAHDGAPRDHPMAELVARRIHQRDRVTRNAWRIFVEALEPASVAPLRQRDTARGVTPLARNAEAFRERRAIAPTAADAPSIRKAREPLVRMHAGHARERAQRPPRQTRIGQSRRDLPVVIRAPARELAARREHAHVARSHGELPGPHGCGIAESGNESKYLAAPVACVDCPPKRV